MSGVSEKRPAATLEEGVLKLMQQPGVMDAVMTVIEHSTLNSYSAECRGWLGSASEPV